MPRFTARIHHEPYDQTEHFFAIDFPKVETFDIVDLDFLAFRAWAFSLSSDSVEYVFSFDESRIYTANTTRLDVRSHFPRAPIICGLHMIIPFHKIFKVGIISQGRPVWLATVELAPLMVLEGSNGYLFLDNDDNQSVDQYSGKLPIDSEHLANWENYFKEIKTRLTDQSFVFCLAPAKEYVFADHYPVPRAGLTPHDQFVHAFDKYVKIINPLELLHRDRHLTYSKNDTHWTDYGANIVAQEICNSLDVVYRDPQFSYTVTTVTGDLGIKFNPQRTEPLFTANISHLNESCFDNQIPVRGNVLAFTNTHASIDETCLIFGSSSSASIAVQLTSTFKRVVRIFSGADIDYDLIQHENPRYIVIVFASRFLVRAPAADFSLGVEILRKLNVMNTSDLERVKQHNNRYSHHLKNSHYSALVQTLSDYVS
ncbi:hypothetical protein I5O09_17465 [Pseudomonas parafulva]|uniref:alginate O-acetyltransferase AlgX-related protein n=1 Tax=Pseudomonas parafulva TaxID=157782 RepID=UPI0018D9502E|nr:hypothetical protein [Pseudomonas parafulva]MBH3345532.1 hypothetical protein [Pseudomonas parafulva]